MSSASRKDALQATVRTDIGEVLATSTEYQDLFQRCRNATAFQSPGWLSPWFETFHPTQPVVVEIRAAGKIVGLAPLLIYGRGADRVLAFAGGGVSDYLSWLSAPEGGVAESEITATLFEAVAQLTEWTVLDLTDLRTDAAALRSSLRQFMRPHDLCFLLELPSTREQLVHLFSQRQRANLRNARSRLSRIGGGEIELADEATLDKFLQDLFALHAARWNKAGKTGVLHEPLVQEFHRRSARNLLRDGSLRVYRLRADNTTIAAIHTMFLGNTVYCYLQGYDPAFAYVSPGTQLMFRVLEDAVNSGMQRFDFLRGEEAYKLHWRPHAESTYRIQLTRAEFVASISSDSQPLNAHSEAA